MIIIIPFVTATLIIFGIYHRCHRLTINFFIVLAYALVVVPLVVCFPESDIAVLSRFCTSAAEARLDLSESSSSSSSSSRSSSRISSSSSNLTTDGRAFQELAC